jgi:hypothetical protein
VEESFYRFLNSCTEPSGSQENGGRNTSKRKRYCRKKPALITGYETTDTTKQHSEMIPEMVLNEPIKTPRKVLAAMIEKQFEKEGILVMPLATIPKKITALRKSIEETPQGDKGDSEEERSTT